MSPGKKNGELTNNQRNEDESFVIYTSQFDI